MKKLLAIFTIISLNGMAQENPEFKNVLARSGLNMRSQPDANARVVTRVAYGKSVQILNKTDVELQLGWISDYWYKVRYRGREGFIFGGYLSELVPPQRLDAENKPDLLTQYCIKHLVQVEDPIVTIETDAAGDSLTHALTRFEDGYELETESKPGRFVAMLIVSASVQQAYILLEVLLKQQGEEEQLAQLRFVTNDNGELTRIISADGSIKIAAQSDSRAYVKLASFSNEN